MKSLIVITFALLTLSPMCAVLAIDPPAERFEETFAKAKQMGDTSEGKAYEDRFSGVFAQPMQAALQECTKGVKPPFPINIVFVIAADGITERILAAPDQPVSACVAKKLQGLKLPAPPKPDWMVSVSITVEQ